MDLAALLADPVDSERRMGRSLPDRVLFGVLLPVRTPAGIVSLSASQTADTIERARRMVRGRAQWEGLGWIRTDLVNASARRRLHAAQEDCDAAEAEVRRSALLAVAELPAVDLLWLLVMGWDPRSSGASTPMGDDL